MQKYAHLVELEKCCRTHILNYYFLGKTAENEPAKIWKILLILLTGCSEPTGFFRQSPGCVHPGHVPRQQRDGGLHRGVRVLGAGIRYRGGALVASRR